MDFRTAGESHGKTLIGIITEYPSGIKIDIDFINLQLSRRQKGYGRGRRMDIEDDKTEILSGIRRGITTGSPISFMIKNKDWENWKEIMGPFKENNTKSIEQPLLTPRPGHADLSGMVKYHLETARDVLERSSARETAARVCVGAFARIALEILGISVISFVEQIGNARLESFIDLADQDIVHKIEESQVRCPDRKITKEMINEIARARENGDSIGGSFKVIVKGTVPGLGSYTEWDRRLDARLAYAVMSIPAVKAFEIGNGFSSGSSTGLNFHDEIYYSSERGFHRKTNNAGGIEGGMTNGEDIVLTGVMKPIPTTVTGMKTVDLDTKKDSISFKERSDICAVPSAAVVGEAVVAIEIFNEIQKKFGSDNIKEIIDSYNNYKEYIKKI